MRGDPAAFVVGVCVRWVRSQSGDPSIRRAKEEEEEEEKLYRAVNLSHGIQEPPTTVYQSTEGRKREMYPVRKSVAFVGSAAKCTCCSGKFPFPFLLVV